ncbi:MAG TPA: rhomboid family intramembrane serine protease, partial [Caulobacteraceae bacterium]|nr:rhomboid family intramembrane serine protease [Caulobacteraceae bacterium]
MDESRGGLQERPRREPLFNAPWTILVLCLGLIAIYIWERWVGSEALIATYGLSRLTLRLGRWDTLVTCLFLHASWAHVLMNSVAAFAFGPPVARLMGTGPRGAIVFFAF